MKLLILAVTILAVQIAEISAHGRLMLPIARSSAFRKDPIRFPANWNDMEMWCGGRTTQWNVYGGKCGLCGGEYGKDTYEVGGRDYRGYIVETYTRGQMIDVIVEVR